MDSPPKYCFACKFLIFHRGFDKIWTRAHFWGRGPGFGPKLTKNGQSGKNGCNIWILRPKITLSTYIEGSNNKLHFCTFWACIIQGGLEGPDSEPKKGHFQKGEKWGTFCACLGHLTLGFDAKIGLLSKMSRYPAIFTGLI